MSLLLANVRLFARVPTLVRISRMNATTTTSNQPNQVPVPTRTNPKYLRIGFAIAGVLALLALFRQSRKEEQLIIQSKDKQHEPPVVVKAK